MARERADFVGAFANAVSKNALIAYRRYREGQDRKEKSPTF